MDKRLKILLEEVKGSDPNLDTLNRNTRVRAGILSAVRLSVINFSQEVIRWRCIGILKSKRSRNCII